MTDENVTPNVIFTQAENAIGIRQATRFVFLNNWMGYWARSGTFIVEQEETTYKIANTFTEGNWDQAYNILFDLYQVKTRALAANDSVLAGAAMVLSVKLWQETVDQFGDIPYTKAFNYLVNPTPAYDKASDIYTDLPKQLDSALKYLNAIAPKSTFPQSDIIFARGGDLKTAIKKWKKFANTIRLRILIRQSEKLNPTQVSAEIAKITADGCLGFGEDVSVNPGYSNTADKQNPFYAAFGLTPSGSAASTNNTPNNYFVKTILGSSDPRLTQFFQATIAGTDYGAQNGTVVAGAKPVTGSGMGPGLLGVNKSASDQFIFPSFESLFLQSEATARGWLPGGDAQADSLFSWGVKQSFRWLNVTTDKTKLTGNAITDSICYKYLENTSVSNWVANSGTTVSDKVKFIAHQKYIALCGVDALEAWSDLRRGVLVLPAGYLSNNPTAAASLPNVLTYPQTEFTTNSANIPTPVRSTTSIFTEKLFWQP